MTSSFARLQPKTNHLTEIYGDLCTSQVPPCILHYETMKRDGTHFLIFKGIHSVDCLEMAICWIDVLFWSRRPYSRPSQSVWKMLPSRSPSEQQNEQRHVPTMAAWDHLHIALHQLRFLFSGGVLYICGIILRSTVSNEARQMATRQGPEISILKLISYIFSVELTIPSWR